MTPHTHTQHRLSSLATYYVPKEGPLQTYREYINQLPNVDHPEAFGQHPNADIASQIKETRYSWSHKHTYSLYLYSPLTEPYWTLYCLYSPSAL